MTSSRPRGAAPGQPHSRFIPREEVGAFAAWRPGTLADRHTAATRRSTEPVVDEAADAAAAQAATQAARQSGYQDGYRDGLVALESFKQSFAQQTTRQLGTMVASLGDELDRLQQSMAEAVVVTAMRLARQVVRSELASAPQQVGQVAREAVDALLLSARHISVRVHPDDLAFVAAGAAEVLAARGGRVVADASLTRGGCVVESDIGAIDASVETRWRRAAAGLGSRAGWHDSEEREDVLPDATSGETPDAASAP